MEGRLGEDHAGELRRENAEQKAERIVTEELKRLGWRERDLLTRRKNDPDKLALGGRIWRETTRSFKRIAVRLHLGTSKGANTILHRWLKSHAAPDMGARPEKPPRGSGRRKRS